MIISCFTEFNPPSFSPQSSSSELSRQSFSPLQRRSLGIQMWFRQVQSDSKQLSVAVQFSSSEPVGHWICPSQRADASTQPTESKQGNWPRGHSGEPENVGGRKGDTMHAVLDEFRQKSKEWRGHISIFCHSKQILSLGAKFWKTFHLFKAYKLRWPLKKFNQTWVTWD